MILKQFIKNYPSLKDYGKINRFIALEGKIYTLLYTKAKYSHQMNFQLRKM